MQRTLVTRTVAARAPLTTIVVRSMGRPCLTDALASIALQQHRPIELLVVDATGGRHPPLPAALDARARIVSSGQRLNRPAAANVGLAHATGEWIGFLDDDDYLEPTHVARLVARASEPDRPTLVYGQLWMLDRFHRVVHDRHHAFNPLVLHYYCRTPGMSWILHRSLRDDGHRLDETLDTSEDWEFLLRLLPHARVATIRERTHFYFMEAGTSGTGAGANRHRDENQRRCHEAIVARHADARERAWRAYFARLQQGMALHVAGDMNAAAARYADALREHPDEPNALYALGKLFDDEDRPHAARLSLRDAIYLNGDAARYHLALGQVCERLDAHDESRDAYSNAARFDASLHATVHDALVRLAGHAPSAVADVPAAVDGPRRNARCHCGSGLRFKACHGAAGARAVAVAPKLGDAGHLLASALLAARAGDSRSARERYGQIVADDPGNAEALHALALLEFDMGDIVGAVGIIDRALAAAPRDAQIAEDRLRMRAALHERSHAKRVARSLATLPFLVPATASLSPQSPGDEVHIVAPFREPDGEHEIAALALSRMLGVDAVVTLWSTCADAIARFAEHRVRAIDVGRGSFPRAGALVFVGVEALPPIWLRACTASRVVALYDADRGDLLLDLALAAHAASGCAIQVVTPSEIFRRRYGIPGASCPLPIDFARFRRVDDRMQAGRFTVGRRSRNDHRSFHPQDPALFRRLVDDGMRVRILGGTVLMRHFPPSQPHASLELLAADAIPADAFVRDIDCVFYRTNPLHAEAGGRSIVEALAAGVPVVCAHDVGYAELVSHGIDGFVFDRDDDDAALRHLAALQGDAALRQRMSRAARTKAELIFGPALTRRLRRICAGDALACPSPDAAHDPIDCQPA